MNLRGGGDFPIDVNTALKIHAGVYALYGAICFPDLNLPLLDLGLKMHGSRASYFYNDMTPESESNVKMNRWVGSAFATVGVNPRLCSASFRLFFPALFSIKSAQPRQNTDMRALYQAATYLVATEGSGQIQKSFAKMYAVVWAVNWAIALVCRMPWTGGGPIISVRPPFLSPTP
jgi:hypothetical protein